MSRVGKNPVSIPETVKIHKDGLSLTVEGPKGKMTYTIHPNINVEVGTSEITVTRPDETRTNRALHGTVRSNIQNIVTGVVEGYEKKLELHGVGYRAEWKDTFLLLNLGYSHAIAFVPPEGIAVKVEGNVISISGIDKQLVGQVAAKIRSFRKPEPYKLKGVRYQGEYIRQKAGKTAAK
ncbi:MAG: 50S ribosomal protein L6 [Chlorobi bacterium]|nr:50S ribosomal protein L6 [Chlorobiota bacterium]